MSEKRTTRPRSTGPTVVRTSDMAADVRPSMVQFIRDLGYPKKKAEAFADAYLAEVKKLPLVAKLRALDEPDDRCMTAGFKAAGINEKEALQRHSAQA